MGGCHGYLQRWQGERQDGGRRTHQAWMGPRRMSRNCAGLLPPSGLCLWCCRCLLQEKLLNFVMMLDMYLVQESQKPKEDAVQDAAGVVSLGEACPHPPPSKPVDGQPHMWDVAVHLALLQPSEWALVAHVNLALWRAGNSEKHKSSQTEPTVNRFIISYIFLLEK